MPSRIPALIFTALAGVALGNEVPPEYWAPPSVPAGVPSQRFNQTCANDPRIFHEAAEGESKRSLTLKNAAASKVPSVPADFRRAHPELKEKAQPITSVMALLVNEAGRVVEVRIRKSSGYDEIDREAMEIAGKWRFNPGSVDGRPMCSWGTLGATFVWPTR